MKLSRFFLGFAALAAVACNPAQEEKDTTPAELVSFAFLAQDNESLEKDYAAEVASEMIVRIPEGGKGRTLVATLAAGENDVIEVNGTAVEGGKATVDASYPIDVLVTNSKSKLSTAYVVKVGKILALVPVAAASYEEPGAQMYTDLDVKINPKTNQAYFFHTRKTVTDGTAASRRIGSVVKWNGNTLDAVGAPAFTGDAANPSCLLIEFNQEGTPYVVYAGGQKSNTVNSMKLDGANWTLLGAEPGLMPRANTTYASFGMFFDPDGKVNYVTADYAGTKIAKFKGLWTVYNGTDFSFKELEGGPEIGGEGHGTSAGLPWAFKTASTANATYIAAVYNEHYCIVRKYADSKMSIVADKFVPAAENMTLPGAFNMDADAEGNVYITLAKWNAGVMQLYKLDEAKGTLIEQAQPIKVTISSSGGVNNTAFGINKATGEMAVIVVDDNKIPQLYLSTDTGKWSEPVSFTDKKCSSNIFVKFNANGEGVIAYISADNKLEIFTLGREEDVLPE